MLWSAEVEAAAVSGSRRGLQPMCRRSAASRSHRCSHVLFGSVVVGASLCILVGASLRARPCGRVLVRAARLASISVATALLETIEETRHR